MYLIHYNLEIKPFESTPDPKFTWLGEKHKEALAALKYGIREDKGFILLTGDIGTGKTTLLNCFLNEIDTGAVITSVPDPDLTIEDFFRLLSSEFGIDIDFETRGEFLIRLKDFLEHTYSDQKKVLLIIDEAQRLSLQLLEQIRLLSNIQRHDAKLFIIFLVGQNELLDRLREEKNRALRQRIAVHCHIEPLTKTETRDYINHRLQVAGAAEEIFDPEAISEIFLFSQGCPRLINTICDHALLTGYSAGVTVIDKNIVKECAGELQIAGDSVDFPDNPKLSDTSVAETTRAGGSQTQKIALSLVVMLVLSIAGYFMYDVQMKESTSFEMEDIAAKKDIRIPEEEKKALIAKMSEADRTPQKQAPLETEKTLTGVEKKDESATVKNDIEIADEAATAQNDVAKDDGNPVSKLEAYKKFVKNFKYLMQDPAQTVVVHFEHNSNEIPNQAFQSLDRIAHFTRTNPESEIIIEGYTDDYGDYAYNKKLSKFRADIIRSYFAGQGIPLSRIKAYGLGSENPIAGNDSFEGRKQNRRVEIKINMKE